MKVDRAAMHRRAQRAEAALRRTEIDASCAHRDKRYWFESWRSLKEKKALVPSDLKTDHWIIRKPRWLQKGPPHDRT